MHASERRTEGERGEGPNPRNMMEMRYREAGDVEVGGVSEAEKAAFLAERLRAVDADLARLAAERAKLADLYAKASGEAAFTADEREWFEKGEDPDWLALTAAWETEMSLDVDDVPDELKHAFAVGKRGQLDAALRSGRAADSDAVRQAIDRLDILIDQYKAKE
jgi:hypothetical protein